MRRPGWPTVFFNPGWIGLSHPYVPYKVDARKRLSTIHRRTQEHLDEKGLNTLFAAFGLATWTVNTGAKPNAPVVLITVQVAPLDASR